ncbi:TPA: hypothetical protein KMK45_003594 [Escherichia coli]|nr:hypothetical protein [Escherichia coli]
MKSQCLLLTLMVSSAWGHGTHPLQAWYDVNSESKRFLHEQAEKTAVKRRGLEVPVDAVSSRCAVPLVSTWVKNSKGENDAVKVSCAKSTAPDQKGWSVTVATAPLEHIEILKVVRTTSAENDTLPANECKAWQQQLTKEDIKFIFENSAKYPGAYLPGDGYYSLPCTVEGVLKSDGKKWNFSINAAATAVWFNKKHESIAWGCDSRECSALFLMAYDAEAGDSFD